MANLSANIKSVRSCLSPAAVSSKGHTCISSYHKPVWRIILFFYSWPRIQAVFIFDTHLWALCYCRRVCVNKTMTQVGPGRSNRFMQPFRNMEMVNKHIISSAFENRIWWGINAFICGYEQMGHIQCKDLAQKISGVWTKCYSVTF